MVIPLRSDSLLMAIACASACLIEIVRQIPSGKWRRMGAACSPLFPTGTGTQESAAAYGLQMDNILFSRPFEAEKMEFGHCRRKPDCFTSESQNLWRLRLGH